MWPDTNTGHHKSLPAALIGTALAHWLKKNRLISWRKDPDVDAELVFPLIRGLFKSQMAAGFRLWSLLRALMQSSSDCRNMRGGGVPPNLRTCICYNDQSDPRTNTCCCSVVLLSETQWWGLEITTLSILWLRYFVHQTPELNLTWKV